MFALFWEYNIDLGGTYLKVPTVFCDKKIKLLMMQVLVPMEED